jgi:endonuclease/exonuclease/phosphatase family metal-dependent hydrolase
VRILAEELGYHAYYGPPTREQGFSGALLARHALNDVAWHRLPTTSDNRFVAQATLHLGSRDATLFGVHFGLPAEDRTDQAAELLRLAANASGPRLLVGDFNSCATRHCPDYEGEDDDVYATLAASWRDAWVEGGHGANDAEGYTFSSDKPDERIDQVWASPDWRVARIEVLRTPDVLAASDHLPVLAELRLG